MIVTVRRSFADSRMTFGQLSMGALVCSTMEPPLMMYRTPGESAIPEGQYPLQLDGEKIVVTGIPHRHGVVLGRQIRYGLGVEGRSLLQQDEAAELFRPSLIAALQGHDDVLLDVINPR